MINLESIFENHFDTITISDDRMQAFTNDHMMKLTSWLSMHVDPVLSALLTDVTAKYNAYYGAINDEATKLNIQKSRTVAADNAWTAVLDFIRQKEGIIKGLWGKESPVYQEFYPRGMDEYNHATKLNKGTLLVAYLNAVTTHAAMLPSNFPADYTALKQDWEAKVVLQQTQIGLVKDANSQTANTREPLETQLWLNVLVIGSKNIGNSTMVNDFFDQSIIRRATHPIPAHTIVIKGKVTYGLGNPVEGAVVAVQGQNPPAETRVTDENGKYEFVFNNVEPSEAGNATLTVTAQGFQVHTQDIFVELGKSYTFNITLAQEMQIAA